MAVEGYGHIDCIFGAHAQAGVFPLFLDHLELAEAAVDGSHGSGPG